MTFEELDKHLNSTQIENFYVKYNDNEIIDNVVRLKKTNEQFSSREIYLTQLYLINRFKEKSIIYLTGRKFYGHFGSSLDPNLIQDDKFSLSVDDIENFDHIIQSYISPTKYQTYHLFIEEANSHFPRNLNQFLKISLFTTYEKQFSCHSYFIGLNYYVPHYFNLSFIFERIYESPKIQYIRPINIEPETIQLPIELKIASEGISGFNDSSLNGMTIDIPPSSSLKNEDMIEVKKFKNWMEKQRQKIIKTVDKW